MTKKRESIFFLLSKVINLQKKKKLQKITEKTYYHLKQKLLCDTNTK